MILNFLILTLYCIFFFIFQKKIANLFQLFDYPDGKNKTHVGNVPYTGGIGYLLFIILTIYLFYHPEEKFIFFVSFSENKLIILLFFLSVFFIGLIDDKFFLKPSRKLIFLSILFFLFLNLLPDYQLKNLRFMNNLIDLGLFSLFFTIFCFLAFVQSFNMYDGINSQSGIYLVFVFLNFGLLTGSSFFYFQILYLIFFLYYNHKNKIFLGDNGTYLFSIIISIICIQLYKVGLIDIDQIILIMFIPGIDMTRLFFQRIWNSNSPFKGDRNHLHHLLINKYGQIKTNYINIVICSIKTLFTVKFSAEFGIIILLTIYFFLILNKKSNNFNK